MSADLLPSGPRFQNAVLELLQRGQESLLGLLHAVGLAPDSHGQAAWPFAQRLATETLAIDAGLTRQVAFAGGACLLAALLLGAALAWRKGRWALPVAALAALVAVPWPARQLAMAVAHPTSFHRSPTAFEVASIGRGNALFQARCAACHGADGRGEGPLAGSLPVWPPRLDGELLWRRADGETFWNILHGMHDRHGAPTMPGFEDLDDAQIWALIDAMKAIAAGSSVREEAAWSEPVRAPDAWVRCAGQPPRRLSALRGQRLRLVASGAALTPPREDPRLLTITLRRAGSVGDPGCEIDEAGAYEVFAQVSGASASAFGGAQLIVDREGWLRAYGRPDKAAWSRGDLLCRALVAPEKQGGEAASLDGLGDLIAAIDADPIRITSLGSAHGR